MCIYSISWLNPTGPWFGSVVSIICLVISDAWSDISGGAHVTSWCLGRESKPHGGPLCCRLVQVEVSWVGLRGAEAARDGEAWVVAGPFGIGFPWASRQRPAILLDSMADRLVSPQQKWWFVGTFWSCHKPYPCIGPIKTSLGRELFVLNPVYCGGERVLLCAPSFQEPSICMFAVILYNYD